MPRSRIPLRAEGGFNQTFIKFARELSLSNISDLL